MSSVHISPECYRIKQFGGTANVWGKRCRPLDLIDYQNITVTFIRFV